MHYQVKWYQWLCTIEKALHKRCRKLINHWEVTQNLLFCLPTVVYIKIHAYKYERINLFSFPLFIAIFYFIPMVKITFLLASVATLLISVNAQDLDQLKSMANSILANPSAFKSEIASVRYEDFFFFDVLLTLFPSVVCPSI